jgi:hypothetical protein
MILQLFKACIEALPRYRQNLGSPAELSKPLDGAGTSRDDHRSEIPALLTTILSRSSVRFATPAFKDGYAWPWSGHKIASSYQLAWRQK